MARILIADDEPDVRDFVARGLMLAGHDVEAAADGAQALANLDAAGGAYDLLLTDITMPMMDGIELALVVAQRWPRLPVLLMTGFADQAARARGLEAIFERILEKPFPLERLQSAVADVIDANRLSP